MVPASFFTGEVCRGPPQTSDVVGVKNTRKISTMKTRLILGLSASISASVFAQQTTNPVPGVEAQRVATPMLSQATLEKIGKMTVLFDGKTLEGWQCETNAWVVKDGAMASTGAGR